MFHAKMNDEEDDELPAFEDDESLPLIAPLQRRLSKRPPVC